MIKREEKEDKIGREINRKSGCRNFDESGSKERKSNQSAEMNVHLN